MTRLQNQRGFTDNDMSCIENATRVVFGKGSVEAGIRQERIERNHSLDPWFECEDVEFKFKPKKRKKSAEDEDSEDDNLSDEEENELDEDGLRDILRPLVYCTDPKEFIYKVIMDRNLDPEDVLIKLGPDDG